MGEHLPLWMQLSTALLTPTVAIVVALIAYGQWRTAHQRLILDLFEKRLAVYRQVRKAISVVNVHAHTTDEAHRDLLEAIDAAEFLFGEDVRKYLADMWERFVRLGEYRAISGGDAADSDRRLAAAKEASETTLEITQFYYEGPAVFAPYMRMEQRLRPPIPLADRPRRPSRPR